MAWAKDEYVRNLLDRRERWATVLSMTAVAASVLFLADHPHRSWLNLAPLAFGALGSLYVLVVNCYYKQAEAIANAKGEAEKEQIKARRWVSFAQEIRFLGRLNIVVPVVIGGFATLAMYFGLQPTPVTCCD